MHFETLSASALFACPCIAIQDNGHLKELVTTSAPWVSNALSVRHMSFVPMSVVLTFCHTLRSSGELLKSLI